MEPPLHPAPARSLRPTPDGAIEIIDQTALPHTLRMTRLASLEDVARAIRDMRVRGAPLIGIAAAYGLALALAARDDDAALDAAVAALAATRPTAVNLRWALERLRMRLAPLSAGMRAAVAWREAGAIAEEDAGRCRRIGEHGLALLSPLAAGNDRPAGRLEVMTHCNAGWLAAVDFGTALAPIYAAFDAGIDLHVWVSETRPRSQGLLTAWELKQRGVPHTLIADNAAGTLLAQGRADAVIVGADRVAANGDVANKVGTYLKALAARDSNVPFFVAAPSSTIDFACPDGGAIPIEERDGDELRVAGGLDAGGRPAAVRTIPVDEAVFNPAFDITPGRLIDAIITERGHCPATAAGLRMLHPETSRA
ncbi:MAG: S-methyl-5-thioribose-1-phosphate isomerase [Candidatus Accumulibacter sp.]|jgi:methylthioribose-1-phosphate isomerase|nr:S-methyl-5-thioribose-1-phosphate isomerase [Accumulibacter sp.]